jgi:hypothetical protein
MRPFRGQQCHWNNDRDFAELRFDSRRRGWGEDDLSVGDRTILGRRTSFAFNQCYALSGC